jgi:hypothetical protein
MEIEKKSGPAPEALLPTPVTRPFYEADHAHRIGKFGITGEMVYEKQVTLSDDKMSLVVWTIDAQGAKAPHKVYDIQHHVGIRFELDSNEFYWLKLQSDAHLGLTVDTLTSRQGVTFCKVDDALNFIGADDIRPSLADPCASLGLVSRAPMAKSDSDNKVAFIITKYVKPGETAGIEYIDAENIKFYAVS